MASIVTGILSSTVSLLWNKVRDTTAAKLKDGGVTDARIRKIIVRELDDMKSKLDGLSRKDLLSSYHFLKEGLDLLNASLDKSKLEQKAVTVMNETLDDRGGTSGTCDGVRCEILNEALALSYAMGKLKINSDKEFESAKERFKYARIRATEAFCNEGLSIKDRIFAAKLRIISEILECLESPETAVTGCLSFLENLHNLPAIRQIFSVYLDGGVKSFLHKAERVKNVKSIMLINYVLFHFNFKFNRNLTDRLTWPGAGIELADRSFNPIFDWQKISRRKILGQELIPPRNELLLDKEIDMFLTAAVNGHGDIIVTGQPHNINVMCRTGESKAFKLPDPKEGKVTKRYITGLAVDNNNSVYVTTIVARWLGKRSPNGHVESYVLHVLDENYNVKYDCTLNFLEGTDFSMRMAMNTNGDIIMIKYNDPRVYVCDNRGHLKHTFQLGSATGLPILSISMRNEIMISSDDQRAVQIYTEEGNLKSTIRVPQGHKVHGVAFHYVICKIIVLTLFEENDSYFLCCFSETALETSTFFCQMNWEEMDYPCITSHPSGRVAVVREKSITFI